MMPGDGDRFGALLGVKVRLDGGAGVSAPSGKRTKLSVKAHFYEHLGVSYFK
jgi:hypothetical protein